MSRNLQPLLQKLHVSIGILRFPNRIVCFWICPNLPGVEGENGNFLAATSTPWSGPLAVYASPTNTGLTYRQSIDNAAFIGELASPLEASSVHGRWQYAQSLTVTLYNGALSSQDLGLVLNGANAMAIGM